MKGESMFFEDKYYELVEKVFYEGRVKYGRNGKVYSLFAQTITFDVDKYFPILTRRKIFYKGVLGEFAAFIRKPKSVKDFEKWGCNYWKLWGDKDGKLELDYGNAWLDWNGVNQIEWLINEIKTNPDSRRLLLSGWRPDRVIKNELSLPCCHYMYQFYVNNGKLDLLWIQRSADVMLGIPSNAILATVLLTSMANTVGNLKYGSVTMLFGDTHIYDEHMLIVDEFLNNTKQYTPPTYVNKCKNILEFKPDDIELSNYKYDKVLKFELKA